MNAPRAASAMMVLAGLLVGCIASCSTERASRGSTEVPSGSNPARSPLINNSPPSTNPRDSRATWWSPEPDGSWQLQLADPIDTSVDADVFDVDGLDTPASIVAEIHDGGDRVICYISAGSFEDWRPDAGSFPDEVLGNPLPEWSGERWLDIRQMDDLEPIMAHRMDTCADKGFDAVDPDNLDGYSNDSGFPLSYDDQLRYNRMVAGLAHERGLGVGLKNDLDQIADLVDDFDFAVNEQCLQYGECDMLYPFLSAGKGVLHVEYEFEPTAFCESARSVGFSSTLKHFELGSWRFAC